MYITSRSHYLYTKADHNMAPPLWKSFAMRIVDITIEKNGVSVAMPSEAHSCEAMPAESMVAIAMIASLGTLDFLVRILIDTGPGSVDRSISCRPVAARWLEHGRLVKDALIVCRVQLKEECFPLLNELGGKSAMCLEVQD